MKEYYCSKIENDIIIDGNLDKPEWNPAPEVALVDTVTGDKPKQSTSVKLMWSDDYLYAGFLCEDNYINASLTGYNDKLYEEEVVEIFIDDNRDLKTYVEIEVNPLNALLHYYIDKNPERYFLRFARIEKTVKSAVCRNDEKGFWSVEIAVPFTELASSDHNPPVKGDRWLINLYRIDRPQDGTVEYSAWSPTYKVNFHMPECFGQLVFI